MEFTVSVTAVNQFGRRQQNATVVLNITFDKLLSPCNCIYSKRILLIHKFAENLIKWILGKTRVSLGWVVSPMWISLFSSHISNQLHLVALPINCILKVYIIMYGVCLRSVSLLRICNRRARQLLKLWNTDLTFQINSWYWF